MGTIAMYDGAGVGACPGSELTKLEAAGLLTIERTTNGRGGTARLTHAGLSALLLRLVQLLNFYRQNHPL